MEQYSDWAQRGGITGFILSFVYLSFLLVVDTAILNSRMSLGGLIVGLCYGTYTMVYSGYILYTLYYRSKLENDNILDDLVPVSQTEERSRGYHLGAFIYLIGSLGYIIWLIIAFNSRGRINGGEAILVILPYTLSAAIFFFAYYIANLR